MRVIRDRPGRADRVVVDRDGWDALFAVHGAELTRFAATIVGPTDAGDVVAVTFEHLLGVEVGDIAAPRPFLFRAVQRRSLNHLRSLNRRLLREDRWLADHRSGSDEEAGLSTGLARSLSGLSPQQRALVHLTYWEDLSVARASEYLGVGEGTVRKQLARARRRIRTELDTDEGRHR